MARTRRSPAAAAAVAEPIPSTSPPEGLQALRAGLNRSWSYAEPIPDVVPSVWAEGHVFLPPPASRPWTATIAPYQAGMLDALTEPGVRTVVMMTGAQVGKTTVLGLGCGYYMEHRPSPILIAQPTLDDARDYNDEQLSPMIEGTPSLASIVSETKSRSTGNTKTRKRFRGGYIALIGSNSPSGLARRTIRLALADEVDRWSESAGPEGDQFEMIRQRLANVWDGRLVITSTPGLKGLSKIEHEYLLSDQRKFFVPCPFCNGMQTLIWRDEKKRYRLVYERDSNGERVPGSERYLCTACDREIEERWKMQMLLAGKWRPTAAGKPGVVGFGGLNQLYSPWRHWPDILEQWARTDGRRSKLQVFVNTVLGETFEETDAESPEMAAHREPYGAEVPIGVGVLVAAVDTQDSWLQATVWGFGEGEESWVIAHQQFLGDPGQNAVWFELDEWLQQRFAHETGLPIPISAVAIDSGGHHTEAVYRFCKARQHRKIFPVRGSGAGKDFLGQPSRSNRYRVPLYTINVDQGKDVVFSRLKNQKPGPEYVHLPEWIDEEFMDQLAKSEKPIPRYVPHRGTVRVWVKVRERNEELDLAVYALAALYTLGEAFRRNLGKKADELTRRGRAQLAGSEPAAPPPETRVDTIRRERSPMARAPRRGGWVGSWKK